MLICTVQVYYDYFTNEAYRGTAKGKTITVPAALHQIPLFIRGGSILATRERPRRSSALMKHDPFTLRVALSKTGTARGELYLDDGTSYSYRDGNFVWREFLAEHPQKKTLRISSKDLGKSQTAQAVDGVALSTFDSANAYAKTVQDVRVEKVVVVGVSGKPSSVKVEGGEELVWEYLPGVAAGEKKEGAASVLKIKDPRVLVTADWAIVIQF
jgi:mannosyl-oligosaccharide alpha-1,3-glucosidase